MDIENSELISKAILYFWFPYEHSFSQIRKTTWD